jgi:phage recombination protein Bet
MTTELATTSSAVPTVADPRAWTPQQANLMVFAGLANVNASSGQIMLVDVGVAEAFLQVVARTGLDPFAKQIYAVRFGGKYQIVVGIDGFRLIAQRSSQYAGQTAIEWLRADGSDEGKWVSAWVPELWGGQKGDKPLAARVGIMRKGFTDPLVTVVTWQEFGGTTGNWGSKPAHMLAIRAESHGLRRAFPNDLSGIYTPEDFETGQAEPTEADIDPRLADVEAVTDIDEMTRLHHLWVQAGTLTEALHIAMSTRVGVLRTEQARNTASAPASGADASDPAPVDAEVVPTPETGAQRPGYRFDPETQSWVPNPDACPACGADHDVSVHDA